MYAAPAILLRYLSFYKEAAHSKGHGMHSPFVYKFIREVLQDHSIYPEYRLWDSWRKALSRNTTQLAMQEMGAGSFAGLHSHRSVSSLVKTAAKSPKTAKLLFRMAKYFQSNLILELGTSLGLSTALFSLARPDAVVHTLEGMPSLVNRAKEQFAEWGLLHIQVHPGNFDERLPTLLGSIGKPDLVFIDGNHRKESTLLYFHWLAEKTAPDGILIFDDIHWSAEMEAAWEQIKDDPRVTCSVDLFHIGIVFFRSEIMSSRHFKVRY